MKKILSFQKKIEDKGQKKKFKTTKAKKIFSFFVKFGHSEKNTKFEKIFHLKFDTTE